MTKTIRATYDGQVLRPEGPIGLPPNSTIDIHFDVPESATTGPDEEEELDDPFEGLAVDMGIVDLAEHFDDYRFGRRIP